MTDITIPPEALEAAYNARRNGDILEDICLAMLKHWPGMRVSMLFPPDVLHVVLPITQEKEDE